MGSCLVVGVFFCIWRLLVRCVLGPGPGTQAPWALGLGPGPIFLNSLFVGDDSCGWGLVLQLGSCLVVGVWICSWSLPRARNGLGTGALPEPKMSLPPRPPMSLGGYIHVARRCQRHAAGLLATSRDVKMAVWRRRATWKWPFGDVARRGNGPLATSRDMEMAL